MSEPAQLLFNQPSRSRLQWTHRHTQMYIPLLDCTQEQEMSLKLNWNKKLLLVLTDNVGNLVGAVSVWVDTKNGLLYHFTSNGHTGSWPTGDRCCSPLLHPFQHSVRFSVLGNVWRAEVTGLLVAMSFDSYQHIWTHERETANAS